MQWESPIKNQFTCGSCWAFAAVAAVENHYHKLTGNLTLFSAQYLVDCDNYDNGCGGGYPSLTFRWIYENGLVASEALPYVDSREVCDNTLKQYEYRIVDGATQYNPKFHNYEKLLAKGPLVAGMDASFEGFQSYRPVNFDPLVPNECKNANHAVTVVATVTENGQKYIIARNSWGKTFGYKGYFKMLFDKSCGLSKNAWLPIVYKGRVPDGKPEPKPEPIVSKCVTLLGNGGNLDKIMETCDSVPEVSTTDKTFGGIRFPKGNDGRDLYLYFFRLPNCVGNDFFTTNYSQEFLGFKAQSLAYNKKVSKERCVDFYLRPCAAGEPEFTICNDVADTQLYNYTRLREINSFIRNDSEIKSIAFYTKPNFKGIVHYFGEFYTFKAFSLQKDLKDFLNNYVVRSIKIEYIK
jgi:hypothetical protein